MLNQSEIIDFFITVNMVYDASEILILVMFLSNPL